MLFSDKKISGQRAVGLTHTGVESRRAGIISKRKEQRESSDSKDVYYTDGP